jgi:hypothetical protein
MESMERNSADSPAMDGDGFHFRQSLRSGPPGKPFRSACFEWISGI